MKLNHAGLWDRIVAALPAPALFSISRRPVAGVSGVGRGGEFLVGRALEPETFRS